MATSAVRLLLLLAALGVTLVAHARIAVPEATSDDARSAARGPTKPLATLGFDALLADYRWVQALQIVGNDKTDLIASAPAIQHLLESVVALDPYVDHPYRFASLWLVNDLDQVHAADRILERGIAYHPLEWRDRFYLSFNRFFYEGDSKAAARDLEPAIALEGAPSYLGRLLARLRSQGDGLEAAAAYLAELHEQTDDPWKRAEYEKALDEIETERRARYLDAARVAYRNRNGYDIKRVEDLAQGRGAVLKELPPDLQGWGWTLDPKSGEIRSAYYGHRYQLNMQEPDRQRVEKWTGKDPIAAPAEASR